MARPVTLFTGQWADLPLRDLLQKGRSPSATTAWNWRCWGDHFEVAQGPRRQAGHSYAKKKWVTLQKHGLQCYAISAHLVGQAVCDNIDARHRQILPDYV